MLNWFRNKKKDKDKVISTEAAEVVPMKPMNYHPKIIMAWAKVIEGNVELANWLTENGFPELTIAASAIRLKDEAREWLMKNGYPHLMAMINAAEGNQKAMRWLEINGMDILLNVAKAVESEQDAWAWLKHNATQDIFILAQEIKKVKDEIEEKHNDIHFFGAD